MTARELAAVLGEMEALKSRLEMAEAANALLSAELEEVQKAAATKATVRAATSNSSDEVVELRAENRRLRQELAAAHQLMARAERSSRRSRVRVRPQRLSPLQSAWTSCQSRTGIRMWP